MTACDHCGALILFGGKRLGDRRFCGNECLRAASDVSAAQQLAQQVPDELFQKQLLAVHQGECPRCGRAGPVDVHVSHRVWSVIRVSWWKSRPQVCCRACGIKSQCGDALFSFLLGWWGFPLGIVITPLQIGRNIVGMIRAPDPTRPSRELEQMVRADIAKRAAAIQAMVEREWEAGDGRLSCLETEFEYPEPKKANARGVAEEERLVRSRTRLVDDRRNRDNLVS